MAGKVWIERTRNAQGIWKGCLPWRVPVTEAAAQAPVLEALLQGHQTVPPLAQPFFTSVEVLLVRIGRCGYPGSVLHALELRSTAGQLATAAGFLATCKLFQQFSRIRISRRQGARHVRWRPRQNILSASFAC